MPFHGRERAREGEEAAPYLSSAYDTIPCTLISIISTLAGRCATIYVVLQLTLLLPLSRFHFLSRPHSKRNAYLLLFAIIFIFLHSRLARSRIHSHISMEFIDLMSTKCNYLSLSQLIRPWPYNRVKRCDFVMRRTLVDCRVLI